MKPTVKNYTVRKQRRDARIVNDGIQRIVARFGAEIIERALEIKIGDVAPQCDFSPRGRTLAGLCGYVSGVDPDDGRRTLLRGHFRPRTGTPTLWSSFSPDGDRDNAAAFDVWVAQYRLFENLPYLCLVVSEVIEEPELLPVLAPRFGLDEQVVRLLAGVQARP